jgi:phosphatidylinositol glycan class S
MAGATAAAARGLPQPSQLVAPHVLHFVAYVPPLWQQPLLLRQPKASRAAQGGDGSSSGSGGGGSATTTSYWVPDWGGVYIVNPDGEGQGNHHRSASSGGGSGGSGVQLQQLSPSQQLGLMRAVVTQLRALLGLTMQQSIDLQQQQQRQTAAQRLPAVRFLPASAAGVAEWEVDVLIRRRVASDVATAARVLAGLSATVQQLPNLEMPDLIADQVGGSTWLAQQMVAFR